MAEPPTLQGPVSAGPAPSLNVVETRPDEYLVHRVSDDELERLSGMGQRDYWVEAFWAMVGVFVGSAPTAIEGFAKAYLFEKTVPLSVFSLVHVLLFVVAICVGFVVHKAKKTDEGDIGLKEQIRNRTRYPVS